MEVKAKANYQHISPKKARLVAEAVKGMDVLEALNRLDFIQKKASGIIKKALNSALANAEHNFNMDKNNLFVKNVIVNEGPTLKRQKARAMGRAMLIRRRRSHIEIILEQKEKRKVKKKTGKIEKPDIKEVSKDEIKKKKDIKKGSKNKKPESKGKISKKRKEKKGNPLKKMFRRKNV